MSTKPKTDKYGLTRCANCRGVMMRSNANLQAMECHGAEGTGVGCGLRYDYTDVVRAPAPPVTDEPFPIGTPVNKVGGDHVFPGEVRGVITKRSGEVRYVVEGTAPGNMGALHIHNAKQLERRDPMQLPPRLVEVANEVAAGGSWAPVDVLVLLARSHGVSVEDLRRAVEGKKP